MNVMEISRRDMELKGSKNYAVLFKIFIIDFQFAIFIYKKRSLDHTHQYVQNVLSA